MNKQEFSEKLQKGLSGFPKEDKKERIDFLCEMIDDKIEEGLSEDEAVAQMGDINGIIDEIIAETPLKKLIKEKMTKSKKLKAWEIVLLALGSPILLSLLIVLISVILAVYVSLWSVIITFWAVFITLAVCLPTGLIVGIYFAVTGNALSGIALIAAGLFCGGLSIFMFFGCKEITKVILKLTKMFAIKIKKIFVKKEEA